MKGHLQEGAISLHGSSESVQAKHILVGFLEQPAFFQELQCSCNLSLSVAFPCSMWHPSGHEKVSSGLQSPRVGAPHHKGQDQKE